MRVPWALLLVLISATAAIAQEYPTHNVVFVVPTGAGAATDLLARILAPRLSDRFGKPFVVENRPGAGTMVGSNFVAKANPDGYTILMGTSTPLAILATLHKNLPYDPAKDFMPLALIATVPFVLVVNNDLPVHSVSESLSRSRNRNPTGCPMAQPARVCRSPLRRTVQQHDRHPHGPRALQGGCRFQVDLMGGRLQVMFTDFTSSLQLIRAGKMRALGVTTKTRAAVAPEIAPIAELGVPGFDASAWQMVAAPAATPKVVIDDLHTAITAITALPDTRQAIASLGLVPVDSGTPEELQAFVRSEIVRWGKVVKRLPGASRSNKPVRPILPAGVAMATSVATSRSRGTPRSCAISMRFVISFRSRFFG